MIVKNGKIVNFERDELERFVVSVGWFNLEIWDFPEVVSELGFEPDDYEITIIDNSEDAINQLALKLTGEDEEVKLSFYKNHKLANCAFAVLDSCVFFVKKKIECRFDFYSTMVLASGKKDNS